MQTPSFRRSRDLDKSNKFGQTQELTNDNYYEIKLYSIFRIEYNVIAFSTNKKEPTITFPRNDNEAAPANGGFVNKVNVFLNVFRCCLLLSYANDPRLSRGYYFNQ